MLVQFMVKNVLSFKNETILDMTAINAYKEHPCNLIHTGYEDNILKVAAVYGANASGKSNLFFGFFLFQRIILESFNNVDDNELNAIGKYYVPFLFDDDADNSEFEIVEIIGNYEYKYGFEYNSKCIVSEWMYRKSLTTNRIERSGSNIEFGPAVRDSCIAYQEQIPSETLALSFFKKLKLKTTIFDEMYDAILSTLVVPSEVYEKPAVLKKLLPELINAERDKLVEFLSAIDTGIVDIWYDEKDKEVSIYTVHKGPEEKRYSLNFFRESEGTIRCTAIYIYARLAVLNNKSIFIDELNNKLHPLLMKFIVDLFYDSKSAGQLIYTTHDTTLLDKKFFRRDQIWFVQKNELGCSELFALSEFKVRSDASFEKDYLAGVYGGIPFLKEFSLREGE